MSALTKSMPRGTSPAHWARLRLLSDEGLLPLIRSGDERAFDVLVKRYDAQLLSFCRHLLGSREDAEDVLQDTWSAAYRSMIRDDRQLTIRAWLYAIARNTCLNAMRTSGPRPTLVPVGVSDESSGGVLHRLPTAHSAADSLADRERFRLLIGDIQGLPENQRTALVLHELDALSYEEIAGVLDVSVGAVKSLLVRARVGLTESAEARDLDCDVVRLELAAAAQKVAKLRAPSRAHVRNCADCTRFSEQLKRTSRSLTAAMAPVPLFAAVLQKVGLGKLTGGGVAAGTAASSSAGIIGAGGGAFTLKAAATVAAAALATAGAGEVHHLAAPSHKASPAAAATSTPAPQVTPAVVADKPAPTSGPGQTASAGGVKHAPSVASAVTVDPPVAASNSVARVSSSAPTQQGGPAPHGQQHSSNVQVDNSASSNATSARPQVDQHTAADTGGRPTVSVPQGAQPTQPAPPQQTASTDAGAPVTP